MAVNVNITETNKASTSNLEGKDQTNYPNYVLTAVKRTAQGDDIVQLESGIIKKSDAIIGSFSAKKNSSGALAINITGVPQAELATVSILVDDMVTEAQDLAEE